MAFIDYVQRCQVAAIPSSARTTLPKSKQLQSLRDLTPDGLELPGPLMRAARIMTASVLMRRLLDETVGVRPFYELAGRIAQLCSDRREIFPKQVYLPLTPSSVWAAGDGRLAAAIAFLHAHLGDYDLKQADVAAAGGLSRARFSQLFNAYHHATFRGYLKFARLQQVLRRLMHTDDSIKSIGLNCGYRHTSVLDRDCRQIFGMSPRLLRDLGREPRQVIWRVMVM